MVEKNYKVGQILKVYPKSNPKNSWFEKVIATNPDILTEDIPYNQHDDVSIQGLCDNYTYELIQ